MKKIFIFLLLSLSFLFTACDSEYIDTIKSIEVPVFGNETIEKSVGNQLIGYVFIETGETYELNDIDWSISESNGNIKIVQAKLKGYRAVIETVKKGDLVMIEDVFTDITFVNPEGKAIN